MAKPSPELTALVTSLTQRSKQLLSDFLGYEPEDVSCQLLDSRDLLISIKRAPSATESFLLQQHEPEVASEMGLTINRILKARLVLSLAKEFVLMIDDISLLESDDPCQFSLFILLKRHLVTKSLSKQVDTK